MNIDRTLLAGALFGFAAAALSAVALLMAVWHMNDTQPDGCWYIAAAVWLLSVVLGIEGRRRTALFDEKEGLH